MGSRVIILLVAGGVAGGCSSENTKPAPKPTEEMIAADKAEQKKVEDEERGTPVRKKK